MYREHFGLTEAPFRITPHTDFFFAGANRGATLEALIYAITHDEGIVKVGGEVGSGKTMLCRMLMERLPPDVDTVYLANPLLSRDDILFAIADELRFELPRERSSAVMRSLQEHLIALYGEGRQVVLLVDEAHAMPRDTLEEIRLLSNLESQRHKLLQIVLFGQPELDEVLERPEMRQLKDRITHHFSLEPLVRSDVADYIDFRMRAAGYRGREVFGAGAVRRIARASGGLTRRINVLADRALLAAFVANRHVVGAVEAKAAIRDARLHRNQGRFVLWLGALAAAVLVGVFVWQRGDAPAAAAPVVNPAAVTTPVPAEKPPAVPSTPAPAAAMPSGVSSARMGLTAAVSPQVADSPSPSILPVTTKGGIPNRDGGPVAGPDERLGPLTLGYLRKTATWLATVPDDHWFLQLATADADNAANVERFLARSSKLADPERLGAYQVGVGRTRRIGVIYGDYPSLAAAGEGLRELSAPLRAAGAYARQVRRLR
jgi:MSHA biogenesis protein MshM